MADGPLNPRQRQLLTVPQVAEQFQVTAQTIRNWIDAGVLPALRVGRAFRVRSEDVDALLDRASAESDSLASRRCVELYNAAGIAIITDVPRAKEGQFDS